MLQSVKIATPACITVSQHSMHVRTSRLHKRLFLVILALAIPKHGGASIMASILDKLKSGQQLQELDAFSKH
jgi:hypothetical protein